MRRWAVVKKAVTLRGTPGIFLYVLIRRHADNLPGEVASSSCGGEPGGLRGLAWKVDCIVYLCDAAPAVC